MTLVLTPRQRRSLDALCDAFVPALAAPAGADETARAFWQRSATDVDIPAQVSVALERLPPDRALELLKLLDWLGQPLSAGLLTGRFRAFGDLPAPARERVLQRWARSRLGLKRQAFQSLKRLIQALFYMVIDESGQNPNWPALQYPGPLTPPADQPARKITPLVLRQSDVLVCDAVVVGSGAGGGVIAAELSRAGKHVIVLEKGGVQETADYTTREVEAYRELYERAGLLTTEDAGVTVLAGATLGGGTTINWTISFAPPEHLLAEWQREHGLDVFVGSDFRKSVEAVCRRVGVTASESHLNAPNRALARGCEALGYRHGLITRNARGCDRDDCGWCGFGCVHGAKQGALLTYLDDAFAAGAETIVRCHVNQVLLDGGRAYGVQGYVYGPDGYRHRIIVNADVVVLAAGAIHSPAILLRSAVENDNIGRNLRLHPTTAARGEYREPMETWRGVMSTVYSDEFANLDGNNYGVILETPPAHPGLLATALPWQSGRQFKAMMSRLAQQAAFLALTRDQDGGRVTLDRAGQPRLHYRLSRRDGAHLLQGLTEALRLHVAAGAREIGTLHAGLESLPVSGARRSELETYLDNVARAGCGVNRLGLFSAHQMGTCRMGARRKTSVLNEHCESWDVRNLFVTDSSAFPTSSGVNPMITIMSIAQHAAQHIKSRM